LNLVFKSSRAQSPGYRADIDGLRAVAVLCVVIYHLGIFPLTGGYVGVDVFFVISGYLITQVIQDDLDRGRFSILSFYDRRIRRIFPALTAMAVLCTAIAAILLPPTALLNYGKSLLAMTGFVSNVYFKHVDNWDGYFGNISKSQVLLHTWSLSVEEQFYLFYPVALLLLDRFAKRHRPILLLFFVAPSFAMGVLETRHQPVAAFYLLPTRAWELLLGAFLAFRSLPALTHRVARELAGLVGLGMIVYAAITFTRATPFPGVNALLPCMGAWLILYAGEAGSSLIGQALSLRPVVFVGVISYSLYLWHWPVMVFIRSLTADQGLGQRAKWFELLLSLVLAFLSFEFIESPFRRRRSPARAKRTVWEAASASVALAFLGVVLVVTRGLPGRFDAQTREVLTGNEAREQDWPSLPIGCTNFRVEMSHYSDAVFCEFGHSSRNILFWGDSHIEQLYPLLQQIQPELQGEGIVFALSAGCPPSEPLNNSIPGYHCDKFNHFAMQRALSSDIDTVFIAFDPWWYWDFGVACAAVESRCVKLLSPEEVQSQVIQELSVRIPALKAKGKRVIVALPFPRYNRDIPEFEIGLAIVGRHWVGADPEENSPVTFRERLQSAAREAGAEIYDPHKTLCASGSCLYQVDGVSIYKDTDHLAATRVGILKQGLLKSLEPVPSLK
jgi:peptidoglycan/LPS O-acetylase OafA/YrhL